MNDPDYTLRTTLIDIEDDEVTFALITGPRAIVGQITYVGPDNVNVLGWYSGDNREDKSSRLFIIPFHAISHVRCG